jgi:hypothetical protein
MKNTDCNICETKNIPLNETIKIDGRIYCKACFETHFSDPKKLKDKIVEKVIDPTICSSCSKDFGEIELKKMGSYPICDDCEVEITNKIFPTWVKGFLIGILVIIIVGFIWNWKFYQAYNNIKQANSMFQVADYENASLLMFKASNVVPEVEDLKTIATYFHGIELLSKDKSKEALNEFNKCKDKIAADYDISRLIIQARIGATFDNKDYEGFLEASKENLALDSSLAVSLTSVASAYACIYADKGNEDAKANAFTYLNKAKSIDDTTKALKDYYNMVEYRIDSKKIIRREEFIKQFPNGWIKN